MENLNVVIAGAGIGGLTAALCLAQKGFQVSVYERVEELQAIGAGIQLSPNCVHVLHSLGLENALRKTAFLPHGTEFRAWRSGRVISHSVLGDDALRRFGAPYYHIHRGDLLRLLLDAINNEPRIQLTTNSPVDGFSEDDSGISIQVAETSPYADVLVGADGIHSSIRTALWGAEHPRFTGHVAWRLMVSAERLPDDLVQPIATVWWGPGKHFVHYYISGGAFVNCVCVVERSDWREESWTTPGELGELQMDFKHWHSTIQRLIQECDQSSLFKWALYDREPMAQWGKGRVTLLGDACHPTLPFMAQGAAMAIEDGAILADCLSYADDVEDALQQYEALRRQRTADIQLGSRRNGRIFHMSGMQAWARNRAAKMAGDRVTKAIYAYNPLKEISSRT